MNATTSSQEYEYKVVFAGTAREISSLVTEMLRDGWTLHGELKTTVLGYAQALVKYK